MKCVILVSEKLNPPIHTPRCSGWSIHKMVAGDWQKHRTLHVFAKLWYYFSN